MRRRVRRGLLVVAGVGLAVVAIFFNDPAKAPPPQVFHQHAVVDLPGYSSNGTLEHPSKSDVAQVVKALDTRAHAILDGDESAFMSVVATDRRAFAAKERTVWQNTRQLHFEQLSYTYDGLVEPDTPLSTPSFLARVTTSYQLRGFDTSPVVVDDGYTFVKQDGRWRLAGVTDADGQFDQKTLPVPWDGGPVQAFGDSDYLAIVDRGRRALARRIVALCHRANLASLQLLGSANDRPTVVLATSHEAGFKRFTGPDAAAVTYALNTADGRQSGWRLVLNPDYVDQVVADPVVLTHELAHLATQTYLPYLPAWLAEGSAEYVGWHAQGGLPAAMRARGYRSPHALPDLLPISSNFYLEHVQLNYVEGLALVTWIEQHRGTDALVSLFRAYTDAGAGNPSYDPDTATPRVLRQTMGTSPERLAHAAYAEANALAS
jgi:hypothetical protein